MWTDNASKIDMLFYKPYDDIVSETAISTSGVFSEHEIEVLLL